MTVPTTIDASAFVNNYLAGEDGDTDLARAMLGEFAQALMSAQASGLCEAGYGERTDERINSRNGYRQRPWDTRVGTVDLAIPKLRGQLLPGLVAGPAPARRTSADHGDRPGLHRRCLDAPRR